VVTGLKSGSVLRLTARLIFYIYSKPDQFNLTKTSYSIFGSKVNVLPGTKLFINRKEIKTDCCKYRGLLIDSDLKWQNHINYIYNKLTKFVSIFYRVRTGLLSEVLRMIYFAFVHSNLLYGICKHYFQLFD